MALTRALIIDTDARPARQIPVMFNPPEYQLQRSNQFAEVGIPGLGSSLLQFVRGSAQSLTMELFFDTTDLGATGIRRDVREFTDQVVQLTALNAQTHAPPRLLFLWGSLAFPCVLESVTQRFDYFDADGKPLRARLSVTLRGNDQLDNLLGSTPLESADRTKQRVLKEGDSLQRIAAEEYGDPRQWRPIADASNVDNPLTLRPGQSLIVPSLA
jgi:nucleoid-associated protein YgaU